MRFWVAMFLLVTVCSLGACASPGGDTGTVSAAPRVQFDSPAIKVALRGRDASQPARKSSGFLYKPEGVGPFPVVVALHHSGGIGDELRTYWPKLLMQHGYAVLVVESFGNNQFSPLRSFPQQGQDAIGALDFIRSDKSLDADHVALIGFSSGAIAIVEVLVTHVWADAPPPPDRSYKAAVAFYGICESLTGSPKDTLPLLLMVPELDTGLNKECIAAVERGFEGKVLAGAYHGFDQYSVRPGLRSPTGSIIQADAQVAAQASDLTLAFLDKHLKN